MPTRNENKKINRLEVEMKCDIFDTETQNENAIAYLTNNFGWYLFHESSECVCVCERTADCTRLKVVIELINPIIVNDWSSLFFFVAVCSAVAKCGNSSHKQTNKHITTTQ